MCRLYYVEEGGREYPLFRSSLPGAGSRHIFPSNPGTLRLACWLFVKDGTEGAYAKKEIRIAPPPASDREIEIGDSSSEVTRSTKIAQFSLPSSVRNGGNYLARWQVEGSQPARCTIGVLSGNQGVVGYFEVKGDQVRRGEKFLPMPYFPNATGALVLFRCYGQGGEEVASATKRVRLLPPLPPTKPVRISYFNMWPSSGQVRSGDSVRISWGSNITPVDERVYDGRCQLWFIPADGSNVSPFMVFDRLPQQGSRDFVPPTSGDIKLVCLSAMKDLIGDSDERAVGVTVARGKWGIRSGIAFFRASTQRVGPGQEVTLSWRSVGAMRANSCSLVSEELYPGTKRKELRNLPVNHSLALKIDRATRYSLHCYTKAGGHDMREVIVDVRAQ